MDLLKLSQDEKLAFFLNLHNAMVIHAVIRVGCPEGPIDRRSFSSNFQYIVGGSSYSLNTITNGILRSNRRSPYSVVKPFGTGDKRLEVNNSANDVYICETLFIFGGGYFKTLFRYVFESEPDF